jgi:hypothetical protein
MDYLAEVSMSILAKQRQRDPDRGYARDFVDVVRDLAGYWSRGGRCRLIANAGGLNPSACATMCQRALEEAGCRPMKIAIVTGDDVLGDLQSGSRTLDSFRNLDDGRALQEVQDRLITANAYMGCWGIVDALDAGADIVITGRVADPSMVVAACVHAFRWQRDDWQRLAGATVAGHLLECGTHVTGGIATDWMDVPDSQHIGFPIAEISDSGDCVVTKGRGSGGVVNEQTVKEQLVYEIGDPGRYLSPDVTVSFQGIQLRTIGADRIHVSGAVGSTSPPTLKVSATYHDGYRAAGQLTIYGFDAAAKAERTGSIVLGRLAESGWRYRDALVEVLGRGDSVLCKGDNEAVPLIESVLRVAVESDAIEPIQAFTREMIPMVTAGPQGTTGYAEGRPSVHEVVRYWPCLIDAEMVQPEVQLWETRDTRHTAQPLDRSEKMDSRSKVHVSGLSSLSISKPSTKRTSNRLIAVAYGRSGDKGTGANIGILARTEADFHRLAAWLTADRVQEYFQPLEVNSVERYVLPNLLGFNFLLHGVLRRGLRNDVQGKALAQSLLLMPLVDYPLNETT